MAISSNATGLRAGVCTSTTRPTAPYTGQIIYEVDTGRMAVWSGSVWTIVASTSAISIDSSNRVTLPLNPSVSATRSSDLSYNNAAQNVPIIYNATSHNVGNYYSTSTGLLTAPIAGDYFVSCGVYNAGGADVSQLWTVINGARGVSIVLSGNAASANLAGSGVVRLNAGDTFGMAAWFSGLTQTITANIYHTYLRICYIS